MADALYGVTMQERGVSKIVSVKFHKSDEVGTDHVAKPLVPPAAGVQVEDAEDKMQSKDDTMDVVMAK